MSNNLVRSILYGFGAFLGVLVLLEVLTSWPLLLTLLGAAVGGAVVVFLVARSRGESPEVVAREVVSAASEAVREPATTVQERQANVSLLRAVVSFTMSGAADGVQPQVRALVDQLRAVIPRALEFSPDSETTFNVLKLAREDLPTHLGSFANLAVADRAAAREVFTTQLTELAEKIQQIAAAIDSGATADFDAQSAFLNLKFA